VSCNRLGFAIFAIWPAAIRLRPDGYKLANNGIDTRALQAYLEVLARLFNDVTRLADAMRSV
jgi:hypothetical protein